MVPGFVAAWARARASQPVALPSLDRLVRKGAFSRHEAPDPAWKAEHLRVLALLGLRAEPGHGAAILEWLGSGGEPLPGGWLRAEFVHLEVGSQNARLHALNDFDAEAAAQLATTLQAGLQFAGVAVRPSPDPRACPGVFLHSGQPFDALCHAARFDELVELRDVLPAGNDGPRLRRLLTEAQMLLHDHPVNAERERRKRLAVNAVWLTGASEYTGMHPDSLPGVAGDSPYVRGLCRLHGGSALPLPASATAVTGTMQFVEVPVPRNTDGVAGLAQLERDWFRPLVDGIRSGRFPDVVVQLDEYQVRIDRAALRRFWRRGPGLQERLQ